jgi:uncharacterized membrane protein
MKQLNSEDVKIVEEKIRTFEARTGCELLVVVAESSDEYPGATWRFGLLFGFILSFALSLFFEFGHGYSWPLFMLLLTLVGVGLGRFPFTKRLALSEWEVDRECFEKAIEKFHTLGTAKVTHKVTAMIMVSLLEKKINVLVDEKLRSRITQQELDELVRIMQTNFKAGLMSHGFVKSIEGLEEKILKDFGGKVSDADPSELKDTIHFV